MIGTKLSHYVLLDRVGVGGMGEVYRARDERLERDVAIKVLPGGALANEDDRRRFRGEAQAVARLNHPSIGALYDFDSQDGTDFLVMEFVPGQSLADHLALGPLPEAKALDLAAQIAEALEASHELGVVHCDLKPGNVLVTPKWQVKVVDFGLARLLQKTEARSGSVTRAIGERTLAGTVPYMAPEQITGAPIDARTDLYALGAALYEMVTGRRPFEASAPSALLYAIVNTPPAPPRRVAPAITARTERLILRALEKDASRRPPTAREMAAELRRTADEAARSASQEHRIESLAVLPLANLSGDPTQEFFADGMTEALISDLAKIGALRVISRTSAMQYKNARQPLPEIARALNVDAIVEGSVLRAGNRVRITAQLIEAASDRHLWAQSYERDVGDVLGLQSEVARAIADEVRIQLTPHERERLTGPRRVNPRAYEAYLRGRFHWNKRTPAEIRTSVEYFNQAIEADPTYALAFTGLADAYGILGDLHAITPADAAPRARAAAERALELDPQLGEAYTSLGFVRDFYDWDWVGSEEAYVKALDLAPGYATGHQWYAELLTSLGRVDDGIAEAHRARELDPLAPILGTTLGDTYYFARRFPEAIAVLRSTLELAPGFVHAISDLGRVLTETGPYDEAARMYQEASRLSGSDPRFSVGICRLYAVTGEREQAARTLQDLEARAEQTYVSPLALATVHATLGNVDRAFEWLDRAYRDRDSALIWIKVHPRVDPIRSDPRFAELLRRMRLDG